MSLSLHQQNKSLGIAFVQTPFCPKQNTLKGILIKLILYLGKFVQKGLQRSELWLLLLGIIHCIRRISEMLPSPVQH
ncbi:hypothetical protein Syun_028603 [Stephania yunnanensis]|uniref:Uncharacterized protein n=1 Tax=Stephania yunnanensis TaxID=152371 RepID=A0AAP0E448_9MAGN